MNELSGTAERIIKPEFLLTERIFHVVGGLGAKVLCNQRIAATGSGLELTNLSRQHGFDLSDEIGIGLGGDNTRWARSARLLASECGGGGEGGGSQTECQEKMAAAYL